MSLTTTQKRALHEIANGRKIRTFRTFSPTIRVLEREHVIRRGPESQHRYGPLTKHGRAVVNQEQPQ